jgi:hypothetical protein
MATPAEALSRHHGFIQPQRITEGITHRQLAMVLKDAAAEASAMIEFNVAKLGTISGAVKTAQLSQAMAGIGNVSTELWTGVGKITRAGMYEAGTLAADQALDLDLFLGMPGNSVVQYASLTHFEASQSVEDLISRRTHGYKLSDRIYANGRVSVKQAAKVVERGLVLQRSAKEIAFGVRGHFSPAVPGGTSFAAMRLARTEINNAHHHTTLRLSKDKPWVAGWKWNLSGSHPRPDACDALAAQLHEKANPPDKPHPQCLCYITHLQEDPEVFMNKLVSGDYDDYMASKGVTCG